VIVLDASVLIALFSESDSHHERSARFFRRHAAGGFALHSMTLAEILVGGARAGRLAGLQRDIRAIGAEAIVPDAGEPLLLAEIRATTGLKLPDCCVLSAALLLAAPLVTFDDRLARAAASQGVGVVEN
jgi:predicted nucleic acid-binding protein